MLTLSAYSFYARLQNTSRVLAIAKMAAAG